MKYFHSSMWGFSRYIIYYNITVLKSDKIRIEQQKGQTNIRFLRHKFLTDFLGAIAFLTSH